MAVEFRVNNSVDPTGRYLTWAPSACTVQMTNPSGIAGPGVVTLRNKPGGSGGQVVFRAGRTAKPTSTIKLVLPPKGPSATFFVSGKFGFPSLGDRDAVIQVLRGANVVDEVPVMVRVRKDANTLIAAERDRFVSAMAVLNNQGAGPFVDFRNMHTSAGSPEAHQNAGFLPWHRAYLLDLERELQGIDPSVTIPYWRFDRPAPQVFTPNFLGVSDAIGTVQFAPNNPLQFWVTDGVPGINRRPFFDPATAGANVISESATLGLGTNYRDFRNMESSPHGNAHTSFGGLISSIPTAARDPLFFLLHCNVDRLWAKWQRSNSRFDPGQAASFDSNLPAGNRIGHNLQDTMWPWNGVTGGQRPPTAPGGALAPSPITAAPSPQPMVRDCLDYQGAVAPAAWMGFDYDDVRYA